MSLQPIRVVHVISSLQVGGAEVMLLAWLRAAQTHPELSPMLVVLNDDVHPGLRAQAEDLAIPVHFLGRRPGDKHPRHLWRLSRLLKSARAQVVHTHDPGAKLAAAVCRGLSPGLKTAFTIHDTHIMNRLSALQRWVHRLGVDGHVAISHAVAAECRASGFANVRTLYNGVDLSRFQYRAPDWHPESGRPIRLIQVSRFDIPKKGQDLLLAALRQCRDAGLSLDCTLAGMAPPEMAEAIQWLRSEIEAAGLGEQVRLCLDRTDIPALLAEHDLMVLPSRKEGFGLVLIEAMASGLPVLASALDGPAELIRHGVNGCLFPPGDADALARALQGMASQHTAWSSWSTEGLKTAHRFSIEAMAAGYADYYRTLRSPDPTTQTVAPSLSSLTPPFALESPLR